jgi:hypothetical protein
MDTVQEEGFVVFVRSEPGYAERPDATERALVRCASYEEARWVRQENQGPGRECIIRYVGPTGGGD